MFKIMLTYDLDKLEHFYIINDPYNILESCPLKYTKYFIELEINEK